MDYRTNLTNSYSKPFIPGTNFKIGNNCIIENDVFVGDNVSIGSFVVIKEKTIIRKNVTIESFVITGGNQRIGDGTTIKSRATLGKNIDIGEACFIGPHAVLLSEDILGQKDPCDLEDFVYVGGGVIICPGVRIASGVVIGAGSLVTRDCKFPFTLYMGSPAKYIRDLNNGERASAVNDND